jgi:hypothetical protein
VPLRGEKRETGAERNSCTNAVRVLKAETTAAE